VEESELVFVLGYQEPHRLAVAASKFGVRRAGLHSVLPYFPIAQVQFLTGKQGAIDVLSWRHCFFCFYVKLTNRWIVVFFASQELPNFDTSLQTPYKSYLADHVAHQHLPPTHLQLQSSRRNRSQGTLTLRVPKDNITYPTSAPGFHFVWQPPRQDFISFGTIARIYFNSLQSGSTSIYFSRQRSRQELLRSISRQLSSCFQATQQKLRHITPSISAPGFHLETETVRHDLLPPAIFAPGIHTTKPTRQPAYGCFYE
jgi:hypothetical protein